MIVVVCGNGEIFWIDWNEMKVGEKFVFEDLVVIFLLIGIVDGKWFGVVFDNGNFWVVENGLEDGKFKKVVVWW